MEPNHHLVSETRALLAQLEGFLLQVSAEAYSAALPLLGGSTLGQHTRHILEFYQCLSNGLSQGVVSYDRRKRDMRIETSAAYACQVMAEIQQQLPQLAQPMPLRLEVCYSPEPDTAPIVMDTYAQRELAYNFEHTIHHMAIIRMAATSEQVGIQLSADFGMAPSTLQYLRLQARAAS
ncbi:MAG: hypothetical protein LW884_03610 [Bacteroidetes bacterium]|jgi:uncharacterized damage-inducible protein DinB|nr:hypothetical protein [Bacteroidota bacterium]